jgi:hypothetical protein
MLDPAVSVTRIHACALRSDTDFSGEALREKLRPGGVSPVQGHDGDVLLDFAA